MSDERVQSTELYPIKILPEYVGQLILDIGGGGEGIIGKLYGKNVVSIDIRKEELLECENESLKIVMNAGEMTFLENTFDTVTSFYTLMYMTRASQEKAVSEIFRVLKSGGIFEIWDCSIPKYDGTLRDIFATNLLISIPKNAPIKTTYGVLMDKFGQDAQSIKKLIISKGFKLLESDSEQGHFNLKFEK